MLKQRQHSKFLRVRKRRPHPFFLTLTGTLKVESLETLSDKKFLKTQPELDWLKATGDLFSFDAENPTHRAMIKQHLLSTGLKEGKKGPDWVRYESKEIGFSAFFSNYPMNNRKLPRRPTLTLEFTGHFFIRENAFLITRKMIRFFTDNFKTYFKINRVDICQDIIGATFPHDYFPNWNQRKEGEKPLKWHLRSKPQYSRFNNDLSEFATGFMLSTSRYQLKTYNRNLALRDRWKKGEITREYLNFYKSLYKNRQVQRLEISLKQDACNLFSLLYSRGDRTKDEILKMTLANFGRNHALKYFEPNLSPSRREVHPVFAELFFLDKKNDVKVFKEEFHHRTGIKISEVTFSKKGRDINEIVKMLGKKICEQAQGSEEQRLSILEDAIKAIRARAIEFKDDFFNKVERCRKTLNYMHLNLDQMEREHRELPNFAVISSA